MQTKIDTLRYGCLEILDPLEFTQKILSGTPLTIKVGFDPTSPDLHLGHYVLLRKLRQFQDYGHTIFLIVGDFTAQIGDPSGRSVARKILSHSQVMANAETYQAQAFKILSKERCTVIYNSVWYKNMTLSDFLPLSALCSVSRTLEREDFAKRIANEQPISLLEFMYPLLQAYDSVHLKCDIELGGSDQKFNLLLGRTLMKKFGIPPQIVITMPLLEGLDGKSKMSKSLQNHIALENSPQDIYGKMMRIPDTLLQKYADLLWSKNPNDSLHISTRLASGENPKQIKSFIAEQIAIALVGEDLAKEAKMYFQTVCTDKKIPTNLPVIQVQSSSTTLLELLMLCDPTKSKSDLRRLLQQQAIKINDVVHADPTQTILFKTNDVIKIGKRKFYQLSILSK